MTDEILECYRILELEPGASAEEVKQAYRDLVKIWHPDRFSNDPRVQEKTQEKLKEINRAYEQLKSFKPGRERASVKPPARARRPERTVPVQPHYDEQYQAPGGSKTVLQVIGVMVALAAIGAAVLVNVHFSNQQSSQRERLRIDVIDAKRRLAEVELLRQRELKQAALVERNRREAEAKQIEREKALRAYHQSQTNSRWRVFEEYYAATEQALKQAEENLRVADAKTVASQASPGEEQYRRGSDHANGRGVPLDYAEAVKSYRIAAELGHADAQHYLGFHYFAGRGVPKDYVEAYKWFALAARQGSEGAVKNLEIFSQFMSAAQLDAGRQAVAAFVAAQASNSSQR